MKNFRTLRNIIRRAVLPRRKNHRLPIVIERCTLEMRNGAPVGSALAVRTVRIRGKQNGTVLSISPSPAERTSAGTVRHTFAHTCMHTRHTCASRKNTHTQRDAHMHLPAAHERTRARARREFTLRTPLSRARHVLSVYRAPFFSSHIDRDARQEDTCSSGVAAHVRP